METIKLDLIPRGKMPSLHASQFDDGREHGIDLFENGVAYKLDGTETLTINERKVDNNICSMDITNTFAQSSHIEFASFLQMCACAGSNFCELRISKGDVDIGTLNFILEIEPDPTADGIESESEIRNLETQIREITEQVIGDDYYTAEQTDALLADKANSADVYTKTEADAEFYDKDYLNDIFDQIDNAFAQVDNNKADKSNTYTKTQVDTALSAKADSSAVISALALKADKSDTYTKTQVDNALNSKMDKANPTGTGSFSLNRKANTIIGARSFAEGYLNEASGTQAHAEGSGTTASGNASHAEGTNTTTSGNASHAEGNNTTASGNASHAEGYNTTASGNMSHAEGSGTTASESYSHAEGYTTTASGNRSHAEGTYTEAKGDNQHVSGKYNIVDNNNTYAEIIGNGTNENARSNARTLDWQGNETLAGDLTYNGNKRLSSEISRLDGRIDTKANASDVYTKSQTDNLLNGKADADNTYTKEQVDDIVYNILPDDTASGSVANFNTSLELPIKSLEVDVNAVQEAGTPTPATPLQISGWNAITLDVNGNTKVIALGGTYYGGHFTQDKAGHRQFEVTHSALLDMGDIEWSNFDATYGIFRATQLPNFKNPIITADRKTGFLCTDYPASENVSINENMTDKSLLRYNGWIVLRDTSFSNYTEVAEGVRDAKLFYELATPYVIDLPDGEPITTLNGTNNIYADTGNTSVVFKDSVNGYVEKQIANVQALILNG